MTEIKKEDNSVGKVPNLRFPEFAEEWKMKILEEIATFSKGKGISKSDVEENGITECIRYGELYTHYGEVIKEIKSKTNVDTSTLVLSEENDVIIPASGETTIDIATASCVLKSGVALGGDLNIIKTENNGVFLSYYLNSKKKMEIANLAQGISVVHLYSSQLASLSLSLPKQEEQNKISIFLALLDERIQTQTKTINNLKTLKKVTAKRIFLRELKFKDDNGNDYPEWEVKKIKDVGEFSVGGDLNKLNYQKEKSGKYTYPIYANGDGFGLYGYATSFQYPENCVTVSGRGNLGVANVRYEKFCAIVRLIVIHPHFDIHAKYLQEIINTVDFAIESTGVPQLTVPQISNYSIAIPCLEEQTKIANFLSSIDSKIDIENQLLQKLEEQKKFLLKQMFV